MAVLKKSMLHSTTLLILIALYFMSTGLPISSFNSASGTSHKNASEISQQGKFVLEEISATFNAFPSNKLDSLPGIYFIQAQSEFTTEPQDNALPTSINKSSVIAPDNEGTSSSELLENNNTNPSEYTYGSPTSKQTNALCEGSALCITGEVVKVINAKTFYVNIQNKVYKVELALIGLPVKYEEAMRAATTYTRNSCLGSNVLIDQDDGQRQSSFIAQVYCSPTFNLNSMLLNTGYVALEKSQCRTSEFSKLDWAKSRGC